MSTSRSTSSQGHPQHDGIAVLEGFHLLNVARNSRAQSISQNSVVAQYECNDNSESNVCNAATKDSAVTKEQLGQLVALWNDFTYYIHSLISPNADTLPTRTCSTTNPKASLTSSSSTSSSGTKVLLMTTTTTTSTNEQTKVNTATSTSRVQAATKVLHRLWNLFHMYASFLMQIPNSTISDQPPSTILHRTTCHSTTSTVAHASHSSTTYIIKCAHDDHAKEAIPVYAAHSLLAAEGPQLDVPVPVNVQQEFQTPAAAPASPHSERLLGIAVLLCPGLLLIFVAMKWSKAGSVVEGTSAATSGRAQIAPAHSSVIQQPRERRSPSLASERPRRQLQHMLPDQPILIGEGYPPLPPQSASTIRAEVQNYDLSPFDTRFDPPAGTAPHCLHLSLLHVAGLETDLHNVMTLRRSIQLVLAKVLEQDSLICGKRLAEWTSLLGVSAENFVFHTAEKPFRAGTTLDAAIAAQVMGMPVWLFNLDLSPNYMSHSTRPTLSILHTPNHFQ
eukprot:2094602-Amphidinium_carterae.1